MQDWYKEIQTGNILASKTAEFQDLMDEELNESVYQSHLAENAGFFLGNDNCHLVISKLKLGSELETDFVTLTDGFSNGNVIELIEIKQPSAKLFTEKGLMTAEFNRACQQIRDWKRWLIDNKSWLHKFLPTTSTRVIRDSNLKFKIIIGRRIQNPHDIEKRNQISSELGAEIRSFDYLIDSVKTRKFYPHAWTEDAGNLYEQELANPFYRAFSDSEWKHFANCRRLETFHFYSKHFRDIIELRNGELKSR